MTRSPRIAVIGGGIGGLAAALALDRRGLEVNVYEQTPEPIAIGGGLNLSPNALKAFRALGIEDDAVAIGYQAQYQLIRSWRSGRIITRQKRADVARMFGADFLTIHRADLLSVLARAVPDARQHFAMECVGIEERNGVAAAHFAGGGEIEADVIVGADGIHSVVREEMFGPDTPRFTGCVCWRGLVPVETLGGAGDATEMASWWGPHGHVVQYPVRRGELINFVAHHDSDAWTAESWTQECGREEIMETYARWNDRLLKLFAASERHYKWALFDRDPLEDWGRGSVTLLGDAAHPMLPYLAQGAGMSVEDGCVLAAAIARNTGDPVSGLREYERLRKPRTRQAQLGSRARAKENHLPSPFDRFKRDVKLAVRRYFGGRDNTMYRAAWIYDYDVAAQ